MSDDDPLAHYQPVRLYPPPPVRRRRGIPCFCLLPVLLAVGLCLAGLAAYLMYPSSVTFLVLGIDRTPPGSNLGRSDTMILARVDSQPASVRLLSIPRDLWVPLAGGGENRINTVHFFAEANQPGSGPAAAAGAVEKLFGVPVRYTLRLKFDAVVNIVDALGGVDVNLPTAMGGLPAGKHHLDGTAALKLIRDRSGADDFFRMEHAQLFIRALVARALSPAAWVRLPLVIPALINSVDTNLPLYELPRLGFAVLRAGEKGIDARSIPREMTTPAVIGGAQVLLPNWSRIRPLAAQMFGGK